MLSLDGSYRNRYYVPDAAQQEFSVMNLGCMANDLADINSGDALDAHRRLWRAQRRAQRARAGSCSGHVQALEVALV